VGENDPQADLLTGQGVGPGRRLALKQSSSASIIFGQYHLGSGRPGKREGRTDPAEREGAARESDAKRGKAQELPASLSAPSRQIIGGLKQGGTVGRVKPSIILIELAAVLGVIPAALADVVWSPPVSYVMAVTGLDPEISPGDDGEKAA
jgi:hypothetical protein